MSGFDDRKMDLCMPDDNAEILHWIYAVADEIDRHPLRQCLLVNLVRANIMSRFVSLYEAKTRLSSLVDRAAAGEEIVIAKNGVPCARLMPIEQRGGMRKPANGMRTEYIATDFDDPDPRIEAMFGGESG